MFRWSNAELRLLLVVICLVACTLVHTAHNNRNSNSQQGNRYCVDVGQREFLCYENPIDARRSADGEAKTQQISRGVNQRIDGTEAEKLAAQEVLRQMDDYYYEMVLSLPVRNLDLNMRHEAGDAVSSF
jgi:hypothetical protein